MFLPPFLTHSLTVTVSSIYQPHPGLTTAITAESRNDLHANMLIATVLTVVMSS